MFCLKMEKVAHRVPKVLESQKSSKSSRSLGGVAPCSHPRNVSSDSTVNLEPGGIPFAIASSVFEKLFVRAITRHLPAATRLCYRWVKREFNKHRMKTITHDPSRHYSHRILRIASTIRSSNIPLSRIMRPKSCHASMPVKQHQNVTVINLSPVYVQLLWQFRTF